MKANKILQIFIPPFIGLLVVFSLLFVSTQIVNKIIYPGDGDEPFEFSFVSIYTLIFIPTFLIASLFQYLVILNVWGIYEQGRKLAHLKLWQIILLSSIAFGSIIGYWHWNAFQKIEMLLFYIASLTIMSISYWTTNLLLTKSLCRQ